MIGARDRARMVLAGARQPGGMLDGLLSELSPGKRMVAAGSIASLAASIEAATDEQVANVLSHIRAIADQILDDSGGD